MPLKSNAGLSKRTGLPEYGTLEASRQVAFEAEATVQAMVAVRLGRGRCSTERIHGRKPRGRCFGGTHGARFHPRMRLSQAGNPSTRRSRGPVCSPALRLADRSLPYFPLKTRHIEYRVG